MKAQSLDMLFRITNKMYLDVEGCETVFFLEFRLWFLFQEFFSLMDFGFKVKKIPFDNVI